MEYLKLAIVIIWPVLVTIKIIYDTRGACFSGADKVTDNEKMLVAATNLNLLDWPSKMHSGGRSRAETREYWVIALRIFQVFFKRKVSEHVNFTLALAANCASSILIYFVVSNYFNTNVGMIVSLIYSTSLWPYQIIFVIGHVHLAQMFFLLAILSIQLSSIFTGLYTLLFYLLGGVFSICSFVSSSASRKYPPMVFIAFLYSLEAYLSYPWQSGYYTTTNLVLVALAVLLISNFTRITAYLKVYLKQVVAKTSSNRGNGPNADNVLKVVSQSSLSLLILLIFLSTLFRDVTSVLGFTIAYILGALIIFTHILFPLSDVSSNVKRYILWLMGTWRSHFHCHPDPEKTFGRKIPEGFRGEGIPWLTPFFYRVIPFPFFLYVASIGVVVYDTFLVSNHENIVFALLYFVTVIALSLFPVIVSEVTSSMQVGKAYFPSFIGFLFLIGMAWNKLLNYFVHSEVMINLLSAALLLTVIVQAGLSVWYYFRDVLPARMAATILRNQLRKLKVKEFYTYDNAYNDSFVKAMVYTFPGEFQVNYVNGIEEVETGVIVIPGTSSKSESMESQEYSILNGDFTEDKILNELYKTRDIEKLALAKLRTRGCSKFFSLETEVVAYRDLILKQITDYDRWIANAWILRAEDVHEYLKSKRSV